MNGVSANSDKSAATTPSRDARQSGELPSKRRRNDFEFVDGNTNTKATRRHAATVTKKDERTKGVLSCAECRRMKLKCDRVFPCQSCVKRGCAEICPDGALTSGKGTRYILANTEQLHDKIHQMSERIRQLEDTVEALNSQSSPNPHPLLQRDLLSIKSTQELYSSKLHPLESHTNDHDVPAPPVRGQSVRPEHSLAKLLNDVVSESADRDDGLPDDVRQLGEIFPIPSSVNRTHAERMEIRKRLTKFLPPWNVSCKLLPELEDTILWQVSLDAETGHPNAFISKLTHEVYNTPIVNLSPHRLSLFYVLIAFAYVTAVGAPPDYEKSDKYHALARAALCEKALSDEVDLTLVQVLFLMTWLLLIFKDGKQSIGRAWVLMGIYTKLVHSLNLHREGPSSLSHEMLQQRRVIFWEILQLDVRVGIFTTRPISFFLQHSDCPPPIYNASGGPNSGSVQSTFHDWKHKFLTVCMMPLAEMSLSIKRPDYAAVLDLDRIIRDFHVPSILSRSDLSKGSRALTMQHAFVSFLRESCLMHLHRDFFTKALCTPEGFDINHVNMPSVMATYQSAVAMISTLKTLCAREPDLICRYSQFWCNSFSSAIALCLIVSRAPFIGLASLALTEVAGLIDIHEVVAPECIKARNSLPLLRHLYESCKEIHAKWQIGTTVDTAQTMLSLNGRLEDHALKTQLVSAFSGLDEPPISTLESWQHTHPCLVQMWEDLQIVRLPLETPTAPTVSQSVTTEASSAWPSETSSLGDTIPIDVARGSFVRNLSNRYPDGVPPTWDGIYGHTAVARILWPWISVEEPSRENQVLIHPGLEVDGWTAFL